jgi:hypothetical protein
MDHAYAEEHGLVESYLKDRLSESEREEFEAHYFDCDACMEQLEAASDFREGMLQVAAEDAARVRVGLFAALALLPRGWRLALAGALLLLVAVPLGLLVANRGLQRQLVVAHTGSDQRLAILEAQLRTLQASDTRNRQRLEEELVKARQAPAAGPQVNLPVFMLAAVRSGNEAGREPVNRVPLAATTPSVLFNLELAAIEYPSYRASLRNEAGKEIWQAGNLRPDSRDALVILLPSSMLPPGVYQLAIEGVKGGGQAVAVAAYPFRVVRSSAP